MTVEGNVLQDQNREKRMGKIILITGASSGIGAACAKYLADRGHTVYGTGRKVSGTAGPVKMVALNVDNDASVKRAFKSVFDRTGRIDVVVNCAGFAVMGSVEETPIADARAQMETNFFGVLRVCQAAMPIMRAQSQGLIINISSLGGVQGLPFSGLYSATKFAVEGMTEALRLEAARFGIRVVLVEPGDFRSALAARRILVKPGVSYRSFYKKLKEAQDKDEAKAADPILIAKLLEKIIQSSNPTLRHSVGMLSQRMIIPLKKILPQRLFENILRVAFPIK
jgi:NAD(P)-dependent dehydrogenase (short-subunit alcohol dehydrogenase family)